MNVSLSTFQRLRAALAEAPFRRQLAAYTGLGAVVLAVAVALASSIQSGKAMREALVIQGQRIVASLGEQSRLALLSGSPENAENAIAATLAYPDVVLVELRDANGRVVALRGKEGVAPPAWLEALPKTPDGKPGAVLEYEADDAWGFAAKVEVGPAAASPSPFDMEQQSPVMSTLGLARVVQSKATLVAIERQVFVANFALSILFALGVVIFTRGLSRHLTRPLIELSRVMSRAEAGESGVRASLGGPRDIAEMGRAFNRMMTVLEQREQELVGARDEALAFGKLKAQFAATVSHEIRTPLNGVIGTLDMLMSTALPAKSRQYAEISLDSAQTLLELVNNILDFSRLESGRVDAEARPLDLLNLVEGALDAVSSQAHQKGLELGSAIHLQPLPALAGDARKLRQILVNLLGNAVKFTDSGEVGLQVFRVEESAGAQVRLRFEVIDTGSGVPAEFEARMFESFTQADASSSRRYQGSGLGLAICRQLVSTLGGEIGYLRRPEGGSLFWIECPFTPSDEESAAPAVQGDADGEGPEVLLVEDSAVVVEGLSTIAKRLGRRISALGGVADLARHIASAGQPPERPPIILVDESLAGLAAEEWAVLQHAPALDGASWVLLTPFLERGEALPPPFTRALAKPLRQHRVADVLAGLAPGSRAARSLEGEARHAVPGNFRILVVDDNRTNQAVTRSMIGHLGGTAVVAANGVEAVRAHQERGWDLILMDCQMPEMDGYEATSLIRLREDQTGTRTPVVAMTANIAGSDVEKCLAAGMDDHLGKPVTLEALRTKLRRWLPPALSACLGGQIEPAPVEDMGPGGPALDAAVVARLRDALGGALGEAIQPFLEDVPVHVEAMGAAVAERNAGRLRQAAHVLKGSAGNLGALVLARLAGDIQDCAERVDLVAAEPLLDAFHAEFRRVAQALRQELATVGEAPIEPSLANAVVLVVDDDRSTRSALRYALQLNGLRIHEASDGQSALALLERVVPDVVLMDAMMPDMDGFTACARLKELPHGAEIPVLMITALDDRDSIEKAYAAGASDYITKPLHLNVVVQRVQRTIEAFQAERHVRQLAYNDSLTGLPNRTLLTEVLGQRIEQARHNDAGLAVLFLDLDRFKYVNDTLGHEIGDRLLEGVAQRLRQCVRAGDCVARLGGDEFTVVLSELGEVGAAAHVAQKIGTALGAPFPVSGHEIFVSASIGISVFPQDGEDVSTLLRHADTAMYRAKRTNNSYRYYEAGMDASISGHLQLESALRRALERGELRVHYQPEAEAASGLVVGAEALVRWEHPTRGLVSPAEFIPLAEETGLIVPIGEWVLKSVCQQARAWVDEGRELSVAVNLSGLQLQDPGFVTRVEALLVTTGIDARHLVFEITESVWMEHAGDTVSTLHRLKNLGIRLAIDDFGTGYSSLSYIKRLPVDILKIDRSFIRDIATDPADGAIVRGIMALAHALDLEVVAEGVETEAQRQVLTAMGCDYLQGYLLARPMPAGAFAEYLVSPLTER
jgi:diguanylate cyclase (GGDEF)-like protein